MRHRSWLWAAVFAAALVGRVRATTLVRLSLDQLSRASTAIVRAHTLAQQSQWTPGHTRVITLTTLVLDEAMKGQPPATLVVEQPGGVIGNLHVRVAGVVLFRPGTEYVLFLEPSSTNAAHFQPVGMMQGAYRVFRDATTGAERVILPLGNLLAGKRTIGGGGGISGQTIPLPEFQQHVSAALLAPMLVPRGAALSLAITTTEPAGAGRLRVVARTNSTAYPSLNVVIPAGSAVEGTAQLVSGIWRIHWTGISVRGERGSITGESEEPGGTPLRGRVLTVKMR